MDERDELNAAIERLTVERDHWRDARRRAIEAGDRLRVERDVFESAATKALAGLAAALTRAEVAERERDEARRELTASLALDQAWSMPSVIRRLAEAADHLHHAHDCDHIQWETAHHARAAARAWLAAYDAGHPQGTDAAPRKCGACGSANIEATPVTVPAPCRDCLGFAPGTDAKEDDHAKD